MNNIIDSERLMTVGVATMACLCEVTRRQRDGRFIVG